MQVGFTDDQLLFRDVVAKFMADKSPSSAVRLLMETDAGYDPHVWRQLSQEVGLLGVHFPEAYGGFGFGAVEQGIVSQEMGRSLFCGPYFASVVMAGYAILNTADEAHKERLLPGIAAGTQVATLVLDDLNSPQRVGQSLQASGTKITGQAKLVLDAHVADVLLVVASTPTGLALFEVKPQDAQIVLQSSMDATRKLCQVTFDEVSGVNLGAVDISLLWDQMCTALSQEMIGGAEQLFQSTIEYMKMRVQFGRAIGSFQALKHRCADLLFELETAKAMAHEAARYMATGIGDVYTPNMAKALAGDAYMNIAKQAIQLRGGIGFTWEEDTHLWFKRAKSSEVFLGTPTWHREQMMQKLESTLEVANV